MSTSKLPSVETLLSPVETLNLRSNSDSAEHQENPKALIVKDAGLLYSKLQCVLCGRCLSVSPVSENRGEYTCGRCCPTAMPCSLYETVAEHFTFPCIFEGCEAALIWGEVEAHEKVCKFRPVSCPFPKCSYRYQCNDYQKHFETAHSLHNGAYYSDPVDIKSLGDSFPYVDLHCIHCVDLTFLVIIRIYKLREANGSACHISVLCMSIEQDLSELESELTINLASDTVLTKTLNCSNFIQYIDTQHCINCIYESCDKPDHMNIGNDALSSEVLKFLTDKPFSYVVKISKIGGSAEKPSNFECPICFNVFGERIYLCPGGHSLCNNCTRTLTHCPFCRLRITKPVRNYSLEKIVAEHALQLRM
ncbi:unnamed protein product [Acanthoscelides obtectus]|uniref:RING-type E3 ubiquitin transferase n=1 Tax=Acanthoscelides obtectus TaxID=200917 RepID=A0A9P0L3Y1_ACAOB|nr:unnamed protein product [Acanthoscelides obtectus]CAK1652857.1 Putative E3 ubiquitin-protein ligase SINA-like 6 [Acanthoscelides obtectus]